MDVDGNGLLDFKEFRTLALQLIVAAQEVKDEVGYIYIYIYIYICIYIYIYIYNVSMYVYMDRYS